MAEPVAYRVDGTIYNNINDAEFAVRETEHLRKYLGIDNGLIKKPVYIEPLYTSEQLHPRVKMTKKQHKQFENYKTDKNSFYHFWQSLLVDDISLFKEFSERELMLVWLNPEATIEIVPEKKWFVRSKERNSEKNYYYYVGKRPDDYWQNYGYKMAAKQFDTKEEAEKWTNPLTEAVLLSVEGDND